MQTNTAYRVEVVAKGDPFEMGMAQGTALKEKIQSSTEILKRLEAFRIMQPRWMPYTLYRRVCEQRAQSLLETPLKRDFPDADLRMQGISEGAGVEHRLLHLLHALEPMLSDVSRCTVVPAFGACSAVAVRGQRSLTGEPVIARNFDYLPLVRPLYTLRESRPRHGFRTIDFTMAPFAGSVDGVNERGLCITYNYAYVTDFSGRGTAPISMSIAEALHRCATVTEAVAWISSRPRWGGGILMLADASGDIASLELSNTRSEIRRPASGSDVLFHTNSFVNETMGSVEFPLNARYTEKAPPTLRGRRVHESSEVRNRRFERLLRGSEAFTPAQLQTIMADHETGGTPGDNSICKHSEYWNTTATLQLFPASRRIRIAFDSACQAKHNEVAL